MSYRCPHCSKPTAASAAKCVHCGGSLRVPTGTQQRAAELDCPRCRTSMFIARFGPIDVDLCQSCGGLWFDRKELDQFKRLSNEQQLWAEVREVIDTLARVAARVDTSLYPPCPVCGEPMSSARQQGSHAIFWRCASHGTWADRDDAIKLVRLLDEVGDDELERRAGREQTDKLKRRLQHLEDKQRRTARELQRERRRVRFLWFFDLFSD